MYKDMYSRTTNQILAVKRFIQPKRATLRQESDRTNEVEYVFFSFLCLFDLPLRKTNVLVKWA